MVLPVPVLALAKMSPPLSETGIDCSCTFVQVEYPKTSAMARRISGTTGKDPNGKVPSAARVVDVVREFGLNTAAVLGGMVEVPRLLLPLLPFAAAAAAAAPPKALLPWLPPFPALFFLLFPRRRFFRFFVSPLSPLPAPLLRLPLPPPPPPRPLF